MHTDRLTQKERCYPHITFRRAIKIHPGLYVRCQCPFNLLVASSIRWCSCYSTSIQGITPVTSKVVWSDTHGFCATIIRYFCDTSRGRIANDIGSDISKCAVRIKCKEMSDLTLPPWGEREGVGFLPSKPSHKKLPVWSGPAAAGGSLLHWCVAS